VVFNLDRGTLYSRGFSNGITQDCDGTDPLSVFVDISNCINVGIGFSIGNNGWTGLISAIRNTSYDITLTQVASGLNITGQWIATTGS